MVDRREDLGDAAVAAEAAVAEAGASVPGGVGDICVSMMLAVVSWL